MRLVRTTLVLCGTLAAATAGFAEDDLLRSTYEKMDTASATFKGLTAEVTKVSHTAVINEDDTDYGTIAVKRPKPHDLRLLMKILRPDPKSVHFEGRTAEVYYPKSNTEQIFDLGKSSGMVEQLLLIGFGSSSAELQRGYQVKLEGAENLGGQKTVRLELTPISPDLLVKFRRIELWISIAGETAGFALEQKLHEPGGDYQLFTYTNMKLAPNLPDAAVSMQLPRDAVKSYPQR